MPLRTRARRLRLRAAAAIVAAVGWGLCVLAQEQAPQTVAIPGYRQASTVAVLTIEGPIDQVSLWSLERRVRRALDDGAEAIVFDLDTPGGEVNATRNILHLIRTECPANTVAWINPNAYSAGTIIALACREIVVAPDAAFGDSAPISPFVPLPAAERAKQEAPILSEVVYSARANHYDENLVRAFVTVGVELWMIEQVNTGERVFVDREEYRAVFGEEPPAQMTPVAPPANLAKPKPVVPLFEKLAPLDEQGLVLTAEELAAQIEMEQDLPPSRSRLTAADRADWRLVKQVISNDQLLVVKPHEAFEYGLASKVIADDKQLAAYFGAQTIVRYDSTWSEALVRALIHPIARAILIVVMLVCLFIELAAPGVGVFGAAGALALLILFGAPMLVGMAQWWEIILIVLGLGLIAVELLVIPGLGIAGVAGVVCLLVGLVGTFVTGDLGTPAGQSELLTGITATLTALFAAAIAFWLIFRQLETLPFLGRFVLKAEVAEGQGPATRTGMLAAMGRPQSALSPGDVGMAETDLRPAGRADFDGRLVDVKSVGAYIERGTPVRVTTVGRFVIEVEEA